MGCFTSKPSDESQSSPDQEKWWLTNDDKVSASAVAESLFCYPNELLDFAGSVCDGKGIDSSIKQSLLSALWHALLNVRKQSHMVEDTYFSTITKIMKSTGRFLRPIDVLLPKMLDDQKLSRALAEARLSAKRVKKEFYKLYYKNSQKSAYKAVREHCYDLLLQAARQTIDADGHSEINYLSGMLYMPRTKATILVGERDIDKVAVVEGLAKHMLQGRGLCRLLDRSIVALDMDAPFYKSTSRPFDKVIVKVLEELTIAGRKTVLYIDDLDSIFDVYFAGTILRSKIRDGRMQCICSMTHDGYENYIHKDIGLYRKCEIMFVKNSICH